MGPAGVSPGHEARVIVVHVGALRSYAIPVAMARAGMLEAFYTDMCAGRGFGKLARYGSSLPLIGPKLRRLSNRRPPPEVLARTVTFDSAALLGEVFEATAMSAEKMALARQRHWKLSSRLMERHGLGNATHVLSVYGQGRDLLAKAKKSGLKVICDVNIAPSFGAILQTERQRFPDWEEATLNIDPGFRDEMLALSDQLLCPSEFVRRDLIEVYGVAPERTALVPYAVSAKWLELSADPIAGRVLFVGDAGLRKGAPYLLEAADLLAARGRSYEFRLAGNASEAVRSAADRRICKFLGRVPRAEIDKEFARADILVLPSLAEGSAGVTYEALGAGIPVVTTFESGSVVRDGIDGIIIPCRNAHALAEAIDKIVSDRDLRAQMSLNARQRASDYTWERYQQRLVSAICSA